MAKAACLMVALCLLAVALATAPQVAFAEEAQAKSDHQAAPEGKGEAAKGDHGSKGDHGKGEGPTGRDANEVGATMAAAGIASEGAAGSSIEGVSKLRCTLDPNEIMQKAGGGAECSFETGQ